MPWTEASAGEYSRPIGENETFIKLIGDPGHAMNREHWAINSAATFSPVGSLEGTDLVPRILNAWKTLRFQQPSIAAFPKNNRLHYKVPDKSTLNEWATQTFSLVNGKTANDIIKKTKPSGYATLTYLPETGELLGHTSHWRTDGIGVMLLLNAVLELVVADLPNADELPWGQEPARLAPCIEDAACLPAESDGPVILLAQKHLETFYAGAGAVGLTKQSTNPTSPGGTGSAHLVFSSQETASVAEACKTQGFSLTSAVHASVAKANYVHSTTEQRNRHYTSTIRFSLRPYLPSPYNQAAYASGLYTTGWMKAIEADTTWLDAAKAYSEEYRRGLSREYIRAHREYAKRLCELIKSIPVGGDLPSDVDISSIGVGEKLISRLIGTSEKGIEVRSISVGVEILNAQCVCFVWTFHDQLNLNAVYNENFHSSEQMEGFLRTVKSLLFEGLVL